MPALDFHPARLAENSGIAYIGCYVLGLGFVIDVVEAQEWIATDPRNADVLFPYLNGEDLNSRPDATASRWPIDFNDRTETEAAAYRLPHARALEQVKVERMKNNRKVYRQYWWQHAEKRPAMRKAIAALSEVLAIALVSKTVMPVRVPSTQVFSHMLGVFATDSYSDQAVLSSSLHQIWAITYGSTLETRVRYTPSDVFETFPRPPTTERLDTAGHAMEEDRCDVMSRRGLGLTNLYNLINDPAIRGDKDVDRMRRIHVEIDEATIAAYRWDDIVVDHDFHTYRKMLRWSIGPTCRVELLDRLLEENHLRATKENLFSVSVPGVGRHGGWSL